VDSWTALENTTTTLRSHREADGEARRKGSGLSSLLLYAESGASDSSSGTVVMEGVMSKVVDAYLDAAAMSKASLVRHEALEDEACMLIQASACWLPLRRTAAQRALRLLLRRFPHLHWRPRCLFCVLHVYGASVVAAKMTSELAMRSPSVSDLSGQSSPFKMHAAGAGVAWEQGTGTNASAARGDATQRHVTLKCIEALARSWLDHALSQAPLHTSALLQVFLLGDSVDGGSCLGSGSMVDGHWSENSLDAHHRSTNNTSACHMTDNTAHESSNTAHDQRSNLGSAPSFAVNLIQEVIIGALSSGPLLAGRGSKEGDKDGVVGRGRGAIMWRYWGGWAMHGGLDLSTLMRGLNHKGRFVGMARVLLGEREREREERERARRAEDQLERLRARERAREKRRVQQEWERRERQGRQAIEVAEEYRRAQERAVPVKVADKGRYWGMQHKREQEMASPGLDESMAGLKEVDVDMHSFDHSESDDSLTDAAPEESASSSRARGLEEMVARARASLDRLKTSLDVIKRQQHAAPNVTSRSSSYLSSQTAPAKNSAHSTAHHASAERSVASLAAMLIEDMGVVSSVILMLLDGPSHADLSEAVESSTIEQVNVEDTEGLGTQAQTRRSQMDAQVERDHRATYSAQVMARAFVDESVECLVATVFDALRASPAVGVRAMREATGLWAWISVSGPYWLAARVVQVVCMHCEDAVEAGSGLFRRPHSHHTQQHQHHDALAEDTWVEAQCTVQGLCAEFLQEVLRCYSATALVVQMKDWVTIALARPLHTGRSCIGIAPALQVVRLGVALSQDPSLATAHATHVFDATIAAALWLLSDSPSCAQGVGAAEESIGTGVVRSRGSWVVVPSWVSSAGGAPGRSACTHLLIQLGLCVQLVLKVAKPHSVLATVGAEWGHELDDVAAREDADADVHRAGTMSGTLSSNGGDINRLMSSELEELSRMTSMSGDVDMDVLRDAIPSSNHLSIPAPASASASASAPTLRSGGSNGGGAGSIREKTKGVGSAGGSAGGGVCNGVGDGHEVGWMSMNMEHRIRARARLLLLVLSSEVRRSCVWQNPRSLMSESSLLERPFALESSLDLRHSWRAHLETAWYFEPQLALSLYERFPHTAVLLQLKVCARRDPSALLALAHATSTRDWRANGLLPLACQSQGLAVMLLASLHHDDVVHRISLMPQHLPLLALCPPLPLSLALPVLMHALPPLLTLPPTSNPAASAGAVNGSDGSAAEDGAWGGSSSDIPPLVMCVRVM